MPNTIDQHPEKHQVRAAFERAAPHYDAAAVLQQEVAARLLERLQYILLQPQQVLDLGCGTGQLLKGLRKQYPASGIVALDLAPGMLKEARRKQGWLARMRGPYGYVAGDAECLPLQDNSIDLLISNLALQWCGDLPLALGEMRRVLKPGGLLMFTTFGPDTLQELRDSWSQVDSQPHINRFVDMHDIGDILLETRFAEPVMDMEMMTVTYRDVTSIMRELKIIGAHNVVQGRSRGLTGKGRMQKVIDAYENYRQQEVLPVSYEVIYGHAWLPQESEEKGRVQISLSEIGK